MEEQRYYPSTYTVTVSNDGNGTGAATPSTAAAGTEITLTATPNTGYHFKEWQIISGGVTIKDDKFLMPNDNVEVKAIFEKDAPPAPTEFTITVKTDGNGTASASHAKAVVGTEITLNATPNTGYHFKEWEVISGGVTIKDDKFIMPSTNVEVKAIFEEDAPPVPTDPAKPNISVTGTYTYNGSVHTATVNGYDLATMDISGNTATDAGDYTVRVTSKTGRWADGSTGAVTAAWSIGKATQEAPNGLIGVAPTTEGGSDGKISGVGATMEYRAESEITYTACTVSRLKTCLPAITSSAMRRITTTLPAPMWRSRWVRVRHSRIVRSPSMATAAAAAWSLLPSRQRQITSCPSAASPLPPIRSSRLGRSAARSTRWEIPTP
ncbi:hypothetical protein NIA69_20245 [Gemmiger formicilis]|nr:hypothetical protein [Gemmiger formicilis]